ncbi:type IV toxin-antitoxin system YeeU family antitoxin [Aeromonas veronii]|uniref:type IV toxin-antitoxin system YeeU family antitoxin n=1 Tax=Aeromonas TaxID=642 RepID=UPI0030CF1275
MTTTTTHTKDQQPAAPDQPTWIFAQWGLPHTVTPRFGARLIQEHHRLHFLSDRASLIGEWAGRGNRQAGGNLPGHHQGTGSQAADRRTGCPTPATYHHPARWFHL